MRKPDIDARDVHVYGGILLLSVGAGMVFLPAAFIVAGVVLAALPFLARG